MNILIIGGSGNAPSANSVCVRNMAQEFTSRGHKVWNLASGKTCVSEPGEIGGAELWQIPETWYSEYAKRTSHYSTKVRMLWFKIVSAARHLLLLITYPMTEPIRSRKVLRQARELVRKNDIQLVVSVNNGYSNIWSGMQLKRLYKEGIKVVSYHLDLRTANINTSAAVRNYVYKHALKSMAKESCVVDKILIPYSGKESAEQVTGIAKKKLRFVGFPVFIEGEKDEPCDLPFEEGVINISYIGTLSERNRDPRYVLSLLEQVSKQKNWVLMVHFWGDVGEFGQTLAHSPVASYHGTVENRYVRYIQNHSDFVLNIGNAVAYNMLPSKVFGIFATGKPIINIITNPKDATIPFFARYNHSIDVKEYSKSKEDAFLLASELERMQAMPLRDASTLFDDFKPQTICDVILE